MPIWIWSWFSNILSSSLFFRMFDLSSIFFGYFFITLAKFVIMIRLVNPFYLPPRTKSILKMLFYRSFYSVLLREETLLVQNLFIWDCSPSPLSVTLSGFSTLSVSRLKSNGSLLVKYCAFHPLNTFGFHAYLWRKIFTKKFTVGNSP